MLVQQQAKIEPQPGPQTRFLASAADIAIYGGQAGAGKTFALLLGPLRYRGVKDYRAVIFRRTTPQITNDGGLWDESVKLYPRVGGSPSRHKLLYAWRDKDLRVSFRHLEYDSTVHDYHGSQIPWIGFDELTTFSEYQFWYMLSRNRSLTGVPGRVRATCNADARSWVARLIAWWIDQDTGFAIPERSGMVRWFARSGDDLVWGRKEALVAEFGAEAVLSLTFVPGSLSDNPALMRVDPAYKARLMALPHVTRERLLKGNWKILESAGNVFRREWLPVIPAAPLVLPRTVRYWDLAASDGDGSDWTAGVKLTRDEQGRFMVLHVVRERTTPAGVKALIRATAKADGPDVEQWVQHDPAAAGKFTAHMLVTELADVGVRMDPVPKQNKIVRVSAMAAQAEVGNVALVAGEWVHGFLDEAVNFPDGLHDDMVDAAAGGMQRLLRGIALADLPEPYIRPGIHGRAIG